MSTDAPRSRQQRYEDALRRLRDDVDCWVATADAAGTPYLERRAEVVAVWDDGA